jgi:drug/metabolite transporter (DMT)-like permease
MDPSPPAAGALRRAPAPHPAFPFGAAALVALSAACFGAMAIFAKWAYAAGVDVWGILLPRFAVAALVLWAVARLAGLASAPRGRRAGLAAMGAAYVAQAACFFGALLYIPAGLVALLLYLFPLFVVLLSRALGDEPLTARRLAALAASLAGTALALGPDALGRGGIDPRGIALGVAAAAIYSVYIVGGTRATRGVAPLVASAWIMGSGALVVATIVAARVATGRPVAFATDVAGWSAVGAATLVSTVIAVSAFFAGLAALGASRTAVISTFEPVVTVGLAALLLDERLRPLQIAGGALVLGGALLLATERFASPPARAARA